MEQSLKNYGKAIVCDSIEECISISNEIAPEHLELMIQNPMEHLQEVKNAGSVFLGYYTCESIGDYFGEQTMFYQLVERHAFQVLYP